MYEPLPVTLLVVHYLYSELSVALKMWLRVKSWQRMFMNVLCVNAGYSCMLIKVMCVNAGYSCMLIKVMCVNAGYSCMLIYVL